MPPRRRGRPLMDTPLAGAAVTLLALGLVMIGSASVAIADRQTGEPFYYLWRQFAYAGLGLTLALGVLRVPLSVWEKIGPALLVGGLVLLAVLFIPGLGRTVNGSTRWLMVGPFNFQVSEFVKLAVVIYMSGYLVRHGGAVRTTVAGFLIPMSLVTLIAVLLLVEPDFGAAAVLMATALGMMFLGGVRLWLFALLVGLAGAVLSVLAVSSPYRLERLTTFLNPWEDPFNSGFQLTQALIAFGRGDWLGVGLGGSVQKLFYLPEAHTDFLLAVLAEELGLMGTLGVMALFSLLLWRVFRIGRRAAEAGQPFGSYLAFGVGMWIALQVVVNIGVNMGVLPTKGLTLPLMSYGGSSMLISCMAIALVLRVGLETQLAGMSGGGRR
ncbi:putative lipid II flippase FtsW [Thiohalomonas denitrificans]|uniref:putative lipid II flippase FtsW n=1 Tax=Thiohalomonas denitrificans TaxID=415747 RepID=UPI00294FFF42|nr:putative lipid II flippase FtsW [Thiohalomonas denitrificans]